jgi:hypothetical protein
MLPFFVEFDRTRKYALIYILTKYCKVILSEYIMFLYVFATSQSQQTISDRTTGYRRNLSQSNKI